MHRHHCVCSQTKYIRVKHIIPELLIWFTLHFTCVAAAAQDPDSNYIQTYSRNNVAEIYPGIYKTSFYFSNRGDRKNNFKLAANSSGFVGLYLGYKWFSLKYAWAIPGTELAKNIKLQSTSFGISFGRRKWSFRPFYNSYEGLLIPEKPGGREYRAFRDIEFSDAGADLYYFFNTARFSFKAANSFSEKQLKSTGSWFLKLTPMWQKIDWQEPSRLVITDSTTYDLLSYDPEWFSLVARIGYSYNFCFLRGKWSVAPAIVIGGGALRELNTGINHLQLVTDLQTWIRTGFNSQKYYCYLNVRWGTLQTNLFIKNLRQENSNISITGGYRFGSLKKRIMGIL